MKRLTFILAAALALLSCSRTMLEEEASVSRPAPSSRCLVHFRAGLVETKAQFGEKDGDAYPTLWTGNDAALKLSLNYGSAKPANIIPSSDYRSATFDASFDLDQVDGPYTFYAVSPAAAAQALSPSRSAWKVSIPCEQTPTAGSVDETGIILAAASVPYKAVTSEDVVDLHFNHLTAYGRMSFANLNLPSNATVEAVEMTLTTPIVGDWYWNTSGTSITDYGASSTLTLHTSQTSGIWFACAPVDVSGEIMEVTVYTDKGSYYQITEFPAGCQFTSGQVAVFTVNMDGAEYTPATVGTGDFTLVTDASTLQAGDEVLIVYKAGSKAMGAISSNGNYREPVDITLSSGGAAIEDAGNATVLTLAEGSTSGTWAFKDGGNYLSAASSGNNLQNSSVINAKSSWTVSIDGSGLATIKAQEGESSYLRYNNNSNSLRFSCYSGTSMPAPSIYRRTGGGAAPDPMLSRSDYGCYLGTGFERVLAPLADQVTRAYDNNGVLTYTLINPDDVEELEITGYTKSKTKGSQFTVSVHWRKGYATVVNADYNVTLIKEEGPKVWLSDGAGNGFIIKK